MLRSSPNLKPILRAKKIRTIRRDVKLDICVNLENLLRRYHYWLDSEEAATMIVFEQAEVLCAYGTGDLTEDGHKY